MTLTTPVTVAELMLEHPSYFVCHVNQDGSDFERDRPMPADAELEAGEIYYLRSKTGLSMSKKSPLRQLKRSASAVVSETDKGNVIQQAFRMLQRGSVNFPTSKKGYGSVPRVYIKTEADKSFSPKEQDIAVTKSSPDKLYTIQSDHSPFFSAPVELHQLLLQVAADFCK